MHNNLGSKEPQLKKKYHYGKFNGTLYIGIFDQLCCSNCSINLHNGFLVQYASFKWLVMCQECRQLHHIYEERFITFAGKGRPWHAKT